MYVCMCVCVCVCVCACGRHVHCGDNANDVTAAAELNMCVLVGRVHIIL